jgi:hypothetical protein
VACPYFMPVEKLENGTWPHASGFLWDADGVDTARRRDTRASLPRRKSCRSSATLAMRKVADVCRGIGVGFDPVRSSNNGRRRKNGTGRRIQVRYVCERDHRPAEHGMLEFDATAKRWERVIPTTGCRGWRSVLWRPMLKSGSGRKQLRSSRVNGKSVRIGDATPSR